MQHAMLRFLIICNIKVFCSIHNVLIDFHVANLKKSNVWISVNVRQYFGKGYFVFLLWVCRSLSQIPRHQSMV